MKDEQEFVFDEDFEEEQTFVFETDDEEDVLKNLPYKNDVAVYEAPVENEQVEETPAKYGEVVGLSEKEMTKLVEDLTKKWETETQDTFDKDLEFYLLYNEVLCTYIKEQEQKQVVYGVSVYTIGNETRWIVPYKEYISVEDKVDNGYFTKAERDSIAEETMPILHKVVSNFAPKNHQYYKYDYEDIYDACMLGLTNALNKYNKKNVKVAFKTFAYQCMTNACIDMIRRATNHDPDTISIDANRDNRTESEEESAFDNILASNKDDEDMNESAKSIGMRDLVSQILGWLSDEDRLIVERYFGIGCEACTQFQIAQMLHTTQPTVLTKIKTAKTHMVEVIYKMGLTDQDILTGLLGD